MNGWGISTRRIIEDYDADLKLCPFCGSKAYLMIIPPHEHINGILPAYAGGAFVECLKCSAAISGETPEKAVETWNSRAKPKCSFCGSVIDSGEILTCDGCGHEFKECEKI